METSLSSISGEKMKEKEKIEKLASETRLRLGLLEKKMPSGSSLIGLAMVEGIIKSIKVILKKDMPNADAQFDPDTKTLIIVDKALEFANKNIAHYIFTIAHEIGHAVLDHKRTRNRQNSGQGVGFGKMLKKDESEANLFAASFLVPEELANVNAETTVKEISEGFGVSNKVAKIRLAVLQSKWRIQNKIKRETPTHIQEKIDRLNSSTGTQTMQSRKFIDIDSGDYDCYIPAVSKQAKNYPDK